MRSRSRVAFMQPLPAGNSGAAAIDRSGWIVAACALFLVSVAYAPVLSKLVHVWFSDEDMAHAVFAPIVGGYILWQRRDELAQAPSGFYALGLWMCLVGAILRVAGTLTGEVLLGRIALILTLVGVVYLFFGRRIIRPLAFPLLLLLFAIPIPKVLYSSATLTLQMLASMLSEVMLEALDYTIIRSGNLLELAGQKLSVAEACSGIRSLFSLVFLSVTYIYFHEDRSWIRWFVVVSSVPIAVLANAIRIVVTGIVGEHDPVFALGLFHATAGWVLSLGGFVVLMVLHAILLRMRGANTVQDLR